MLTPRDLLRMNGWGDEDIEALGTRVRSDYTYADTLRRLREGLPTDPAVIEFNDEADNRVEGQHRAFAAMELGIERIPVVIRRV